MTPFIVFFVYQGLQIIAFPILVLLIAFLHFKRGIVGSLLERLGYVPSSANKKIIWLHAVSVGEVLSLQYLIDLIKKQNPDASCYLTVGTVSGRCIAQKFIKADFISYLPYDFLPCMLLAYARIKPKVVIIVESELWPNFLSIGYLKKIPLFLLNARINPYSLSRFLVVRWLFKNFINFFKIIFAQSEQDRDYFVQSGVDPQKVLILGNLKAFNVVSKKKDLIVADGYVSGFSSGFKTLLVGSMHPGEEEIYLKLFKIHKKEFEGLRLILVPRHLTWQSELIKKVKRTGYSYFVWTENHQLEDIKGVSEKNEVLLVCKLGELFKLYQHSDIYFLGGTFVPVGGHNLLEPAVWSVPAVVGPYNKNCRDIADKLSCKDGIVKVQDFGQLLEKTRKLLLDSELRINIGMRSNRWVEKESKRVRTTLEILLNELKRELKEKGGS